MSSRNTVTLAHRGIGKHLTADDLNNIQTPRRKPGGFLLGRFIVGRIRLMCGVGTPDWLNLTMISSQKKAPPLGELLLGIMWGLTLGIIGVAGLGHLLRATGGIVGPIRHLNCTVGGYSSVFFSCAPNYECGERCHSECSGDIFGVLLQHFFLSISICSLGSLSLAPRILHKRQALGNPFPEDFSRKFREREKPGQKT
jgi:hypothetical protein